MTVTCAVNENNFTDWIEKEDPNLEEQFMTDGEAAALNSEEIYQKAVEMLGKDCHNSLAVASILFYEEFPNAVDIVNDPTEANRNQRRLIKLAMLTVINAYDHSTVRKCVDTQETRDLYVRVMATILENRDRAPIDVVNEAIDDFNCEGFKAMAEDDTAMAKFVAWAYKVRDVFNKIRVIGSF